MNKEMTKKEAIQLMVSRDFHAIRIEWVQIVAKNKGEEIYAWPMWGYMWMVDDFIGDRLMKNAVRMEECEKHGEITDEESPSCDNCDRYDEEMEGAYNIRGTSAYIYEIDGQHVVGVHGAGWDFYDGVWDRLYDILGLQWHTKN